MLFTCQMCGETFEGRRRDALWCSVGCRVAAHNGTWHPELQPRPAPTADDLAEAASLAPLIAWARQQGVRLAYELKDEHGAYYNYVTDHERPDTPEGIEEALAFWDAEDFVERWWKEAPETDRLAREELDDLPG